MNRSWLVTLAGLVAALLLSAAALAARSAELEDAGNDVGDRASLQRGAQLFMSYCSGCHSLKYLRYSRMATDLGLSEQQVMNELNFTGGGFDAGIVNAMPHEGSVTWFGQAPPDLSLTARVRGTDWIYTYLQSFYLDASRPLGWNNSLFVDATMPNPLWQLQGMRLPEYAAAGVAGGAGPVVKFRVSQPGLQSPPEFDQTVRDISNFLEYAAEPAALKRRGLGMWVILFLALFTLLAFLLKKEYWKDVH